ncbi:MAG: hypothetical protein AB8B56_21725 [Crocinitomicaceae bacterium]
MKWEISKISFLTFLTLLVLHWALNVNCPQTEIFTGDSLYLFLKSLVIFIIGCIIWIFGYLFFLKFERWHGIVKKYFILLTILASFPLANSIWENSFSSDRQLSQSICSKSSDDGMFCSMDRLTFDEYMYLYNKSEWLPLIPSHSESVMIDYYRDDFLGDYWFSLWIEIPARPKFDSIEFSQIKKTPLEEENELKNNSFNSDQRPFGENTYHYSISSGE